jgi:two-component system nitrate/nitrite response regulator NarL
MNELKTPIRVLLVDDHPVVCLGLKLSFRRHKQIKLVGVAHNGREALEQARASRPDVVVSNVEMPVMNGVDLTVALSNELPEIRVLAYSIHLTPGHVLRMVQAGASGYVFKQLPPEELLRGIVQVARGEPFFSAGVVQAALRQDVSTQFPGSQAITPREREVITWVAEGLSNREIAKRLCIGIRTVATHRERAMRKLDIRGTPGLTKYALIHGWVRLKDQAALSGSTNTLKGTA